MHQIKIIDGLIDGKNCQFKYWMPQIAGHFKQMAGPANQL